MSATAIPTFIVPVKVVDFSNTVLTLTLGKTRYGTAQPQLDIFLPPGTTHRQASALLHTFAASLELNTPCAYPKFSRCVMSASRLRQNVRHDVSDAHDEPLGPPFRLIGVGIMPGSDASTPLCLRVDTPQPSCERR
ncbi:hypothetical protein [Myxococcus sp. AM011]|uniref:hypothetical protein n=1 Tax=Myxococcus sp. AM011 TaxID=2745200 RepID=UPI0020CFA290|nr:hypothetical protein [Myxococcus sp. AM011]